MGYRRASNLRVHLIIGEFLSWLIVSMWRDAGFNLSCLHSQISSYLVPPLIIYPVNQPTSLGPATIISFSPAVLLLQLWIHSSIPLLPLLPHPYQCRHLPTPTILPSALGLAQTMAVASTSSPIRSSRPAALPPGSVSLLYHSPVSSGASVVRARSSILARLGGMGGKGEKVVRVRGIGSWTLLLSGVCDV
jgi:hypothetical protein